MSLCTSIGWHPRLDYKSERHILAASQSVSPTYFNPSSRARCCSRLRRTSIGPSRHRCLFLGRSPQSRSAGRRTPPPTVLTASRRAQLPAEPDRSSAGASLALGLESRPRNGSAGSQFLLEIYGLRGVGLLGLLAQVPGPNPQVAPSPIKFQ